MRYQNREIVEAEQWFPGKPTPGVQDDHPEGATKIKLCGCILAGFEGGRPHIHYNRLCQGTFLDPGDWVIKNTDGGYDRMKPAEFEARYGITMHTYRYRIEFADGPAQNYFQAEDDVAAVRAVFNVGAALAPVLLSPITRIVVESAVLGPITATGDCETTVDRCLYDSSELDTSILEERPAYLAQ